MSRAPGLEDLRTDAASVVRNPHAQLMVGVFKFELDALRLGMTKGIDQSFSSNPVNLMLDEWLKRLLPASDNDVEDHIWVGRKFLPDPGQGRDQVERTSARRAEALYRAPAFVDT